MGKKVRLDNIGKADVGLGVLGAATAGAASIAGFVKGDDSAGWGEGLTAFWDAWTVAGKTGHLEWLGKMYKVNRYSMTERAQMGLEDAAKFGGEAVDAVLHNAGVEFEKQRAAFMGEGQKFVDTNIVKVKDLSGDLQLKGQRLVQDAKDAVLDVGDEFKAHGHGLIKDAGTRANNLVQDVQDGAEHFVKLAKNEGQDFIDTAAHKTGLLVDKASSEAGKIGERGAMKLDHIIQDARVNSSGITGKIVGLGDNKALKIKGMSAEDQARLTHYDSNNPVYKQLREHEDKFYVKYTDENIQQSLIKPISDEHGIRIMQGDTRTDTRNIQLANGKTYTQRVIEKEQGNSLVTREALYSRDANHQLAIKEYFDGEGNVKSRIFIEVDKSSPLTKGNNYKIIDEFYPDGSVKRTTYHPNPKNPKDGDTFISIRKNDEVIHFEVNDRELADLISTEKPLSLREKSDIEEFDDIFGQIEEKIAGPARQEQLAREKKLKQEAELQERRQLRQDQQLSENEAYRELQERKKESRLLEEEQQELQTKALKENAQVRREDDAAKKVQARKDEDDTLALEREKRNKPVIEEELKETAPITNRKIKTDIHEDFFGEINEHAIADMDADFFAQKAAKSGEKVGMPKPQFRDTNEKVNGKDIHEGYSQSLAILFLAQLCIQSMIFRCGFGEPDEGDQLEDSKAQFQKAYDALKDARADSKKWSGDAADNYNDANNAQMARAATAGVDGAMFSDIDDSLATQLQDILSAEAWQVWEVKLILECFLTAIGLAFTIAMWINMISPKGAIAFQISVFMTLVPTATHYMVNLHSQSGDNADSIARLTSRFNDIAAEAKKTYTSFNS